MLSVRPRFADQIVSGTKRVEFRRTWAAEPVSVLAIYSTAPVQRILGLAFVQEVIEASPSKLWHYASELGGGLTKRELFDYFDGRETGFAVLVKRVELMRTPLDPVELCGDFRAPQSFRYLTSREVRNLAQRARRLMSQQ